MKNWFIWYINFIYQVILLYVRSFLHALQDYKQDQEHFQSKNNNEKVKSKTSQIGLVGEDSALDMSCKNNTSTRFYLTRNKKFLSSMTINTLIKRSF